jgi:fatty acid desaturase
VSITAFTVEERGALSRKKLFPRLLCLPATVIGIHMLRRAWPSDEPAFLALLTVWTSYALFCCTSCFHECAHQTLSGRSWFDVLLGRMLGTMMLTPYTVYRETHIRHHAYLNKPYDWELWPYADPACSVGFRRFFVWIDLLCGALTSPYIYGRIFFSGESPLRGVVTRRTIALEYLAIVAFWGILCGAVAWFGFGVPLTRAWLVPWWLAGIIQSGRKLTEHLGMASYDPLLGTRTVLATSRLTRFLTYVNFDIFVHGAHHRHPRIAHNELRSKMTAYLEESPNVPYPVYQSYWQATYAMLPSLVRNPGCGMNAGAAAPHDGKNPDVDYFVGDVTREVLVAEDQARVNEPAEPVAV